MGTWETDPHCGRRMFSRPAQSYRPLEPLAGLSWREPSLNSGTLNPGNSVAGWMTFELPDGADRRRLVWEPTFDVSLAIDL